MNVDYIFMSAIYTFVSLIMEKNVYVHMVADRNHLN